jgi:hypothetical protein
MADHERAQIPAAVLVDRGERPPDYMHLVVDDEVLLEMDGAAFGHKLGRMPSDP